MSTCGGSDPEAARALEGHEGLGLVARPVHRVEVQQQRVRRPVFVYTDFGGTLSTFWRVFHTADTARILLQGRRNG